MSGSNTFDPGVSLTGPIRWGSLSCELFKLHLSLYIALSAVFGHVIAQSRFSAASLAVGGLVLLLSAGAALWNHIQDREYDRWFQRTRHRALAQRMVSVRTAGIAAFSLISIGLLGIFFFLGVKSFLAGILALLCYNGLYTPLKKKTLFAILPGIVCGMLPPVIGWFAVPEPLRLPGFKLIGAACLVFALWQIPHFFLILLKQPKTSKASIYPCFSKRLAGIQLIGQARVWTCLYSLAVLLFLLNGGILSLGLKLFVCLAALGIPLGAVLLLPGHRSPYGFQRPAWMLGFLNLSMLFFMAAGILDRMIV